MNRANTTTADAVSLAGRTAAGEYPGRAAGLALKAMAASWLVVAVLGQLMMAAYVVVFFWLPMFAGDLQRRNSGRMPHGYVPGDIAGNLALASHVLFTVVIVLGGALQLTPWVRRRWPAFHRWTGRAYLLAAVVLSPGGLYLLATRKADGLGGSPGIGLNALLILAFAALALREAMARRIDRHRRWALRLFLAASGV